MIVHMNVHISQKLENVIVFNKLKFLGRRSCLSFKKLNKFIFFLHLDSWNVTNR